MNRIISIILIILILLASNSCKKYPNGPKISFRSKNNRIEGTWRIAHIYKPNFGQTQEINLDSATLETRYIFNKNGDGKEIKEKETNEIKWKLVNDKKTLQILYLETNEQYDYDILKLKNSELELKLNNPTHTGDWRQFNLFLVD